MLLKGWAAWAGSSPRCNSCRDLEASRCIGRAAARPKVRPSPHQAGAFHALGHRSRGSTTSLFLHPHGTPAEGGGGDRLRPRRSRGTLREAAAGRSCLGRGERRDLPLITIRGTFAPVASDRHHGLMSTRQLSLLASGHQGAGVDRSKSMSPEVPVDPPEARKRGGANGGVLNGSPAENPVMPMTVKISSEDTLSVSSFAVKEACKGRK